MPSFSPISHECLPVMDTQSAHAVMQEHIDCLLSCCPVKRQAKHRLVMSGRLVPADAETVRAQPIVTRRVSS